ncbi:MAG: 50S ribosomal protein L2 [Candidatus Liptonbacteria bacterium]|nr:50S ribosomal protein L2 [Candidatus Liptonbacteria bacterium]
MKSYAPYTPSRRFITGVDYRVLSKVKPLKKLLTTLKSHAGRNSAGRITVRHQGGGVKRRYRLVDFKQERRGEPAKVVAIEYDPYRTSFIARIAFADGELRYVAAPHGLKVGDTITAADSAPLTVGNRMMLKNIPVGYQVHNVETRPGSGGVLGRSAGSYAEVLANADGYTDLKLSSGAVRRVPWESFASLGQMSNPEHNLVVIGKAGRSRWKGVRPTVRGMVMNPVDHPYGGGEGRQPRGTRKPKTLWGKVTGGRRTRNRKKWSNAFIVQRRATK